MSSFFGSAGSSTALKNNVIEAFRSIRVVKRVGTFDFDKVSINEDLSFGDKIAVAFPISNSFLGQRENRGLNFNDFYDFRVSKCLAIPDAYLFGGTNSSPLNNIGKASDYMRNRNNKTLRGGSFSADIFYNSYYHSFIILLPKRFFDKANKPEVLVLPIEFECRANLKIRLDSLGADY